MNAAARIRRYRLLGGAAAVVAVVATLVVGVGMFGSAPAGAVEAPPLLDVPVVPERLSMTPIPGGGVQGRTAPLGSQNWRVRAFAQIGERIYVGGAFTTVRERPFAGSATTTQSYLAAFDLDTNNWISTFRPTFDRPVWTLAVSPDGKLLVGGEFATVNGVARRGLVKLDPTTGATDTSFRATIANDGNTYVPSVRGLEVVGDDLYVVGDFNRLVVEGGFRNGTYNAARVSAATGAWDSAWYPRVTGGAVFDLAVDAERGKVHLAGTFTAVNASTSTKAGAVVTVASGATVPNHPYALNNSANLSFAVALLGDRVFYGGEQHLLQGRDAATFARLGCMATGYTGSMSTQCVAGTWVAGANGGGDYQVVEAIDGFLVGGCHCRGNHYSSFTGQVTTMAGSGVRLYRPDGTDIVSVTALPYWDEGPYAAFGDTNGCLYLGGDFTGNVDGFGRLCQPVNPPERLSATASGTAVALTWAAPAVAAGGIARYEVLRNGSVIGTSTTRTYTDRTAVEGTSYTYAVRAVATTPTGFLSDPSIPVTFGIIRDTAAPTTPQNVDATVDGVAPSVTLSWQASADNVGVTGYLVHRDFQFVAWVPAGTTYTDNTVAVGRTYRYEIRAQDAAGNNSSPSTPRNVTIAGPPDTIVPSVPTGVTATVNGTAIDLAWEASTDNVGVTGYLVHRDFQFLAWVPAATTYRDTTIVPGAVHRYEIRAQDAVRNTSAPSAPVEAAVGSDTTPPTVPTDVVAAVNGASVALSWTASTDNVGVKGYLVHRNGSFLAWVPQGTTFVDDTAVAGQPQSYEIRAQDRAGNNSPPSAPVTVTVP